MIKKVGLLGAGSVGSGLIYKMYKVDPDNVYVVARGSRAERIASEGISVNNDTIRPVVYSDRSQDIHLDLLIIAVKTYSLEEAIADAAELIDKDTIILPIQNGITATDRLREAFPDNKVLMGIVIRTDAHRMNHRVYCRTLGEMQIGYENNTVIKPEVSQVYERLKELDINVKIYEDMKKAQWRKWMLNVAGGQVAAETHAECGYFSQIPEIRELLTLCMDEIVALAKAEKVNITEQDKDEILEFLISYPPDKKMSMLQDVESGRKLESAEYGAKVVELGRKHGIPTPINEAMHLIITTREKVRHL